MNLHTLKERLAAGIDESRILMNEPMKNHTSFKIGGPADIVVIPESVDEVKHAVDLCRTLDIPYHIMGNGSNLLVCDTGIEGVVIKIAEQFNAVSIQGQTITAQAGVLLSSLSNKIMDAHLKGFEFASGIPGTLGGAVFMNAGAYGGEMKDVLVRVTVLDPQQGIKELMNGELELGYRDSVIQRSKYIVLEAEIKLERGDHEQIRTYTRELTEKRTTKQPLHLPSAGSTFKRPPNHYAGKLIQDAGLKGVRFGDAQVSDKHCGFVVNHGKSTCGEILSLIEFVQKVVYDQFEVKLEPEVRFLGRGFDDQNRC